MLSIKNIASNKAIIIILLIVQLLFPLYPVLAAETDNDCKCEIKSPKSDCCCDDESCSSVPNYCDMNNISSRTRLVPSCNCLVKTVSQTEEIKTQQNFELNKIAEIEFINFNFTKTYSNIIFQEIEFIKSLNGPPIYLSDSTFLI